MLDSLVQQFAGGGGASLGGDELHGAVAQIIQAAPNQHAPSAFSEALSALGASGFGSSVAEGSASATPAERSGLAGLFSSAISQGGGSPSGVLSQLGIGGQNIGPSELGQLAEHVGTNHPDALAGILGGQLSGGGGTGGVNAGTVMKLLGNPMVRQLGMHLAQKLI